MRGRRGSSISSLGSTLPLSSCNSSVSVGLRSTRTGSNGQITESDPFVSGNPPHDWSTESEGYVAAAAAQAAGVSFRGPL